MGGVFGWVLVHLLDVAVVLDASGVSSAGCGTGNGQEGMWRFSRFGDCC